MSEVVEIRQGYRYYGRGTKKNVILNRLDMQIKQGSIYGLLGASGCGKTTLISCIVGLQTMQEGELYVLRKKVCIKNSNMYGPRIGYMPQETALLRDLTVKEIIYYFGNIYGLNIEQLRIQYKFLSQLLDLPNGDQSVEDCSGGQQRRVSLAIAIVHSPELIILDEPTVGLDSILRDKIWGFLLDKVKNGNVTILLTTHYIEEARQASVVGFMRDGILLAQDHPNTIMERLGTSTLEEAFSILCNNPNPVSVGYSSEINSTEIVVDHVSTADTETKKISKITIAFFRRMKALLVKNALQILRQPMILVFFGLTVLSFAIFFGGIGDDPKHLKIGVVNEEVSSYKDCLSETLITVVNGQDGCEWDKLSCRFLDGVTPNILEKIYFDSFDEAYQQARKGRVVGVIHFASNYTESLSYVIKTGVFGSDEIMETKNIDVYLDQSDRQITMFITKNLLKVHETYMEDLMLQCNYPKRLQSLPVSFEVPIYGSYDEKFTSFLTFGVATAWMFYFSILLTITAFIDDRLSGVWNRTLVAGVNSYEFFFSHLITQTIAMMVECCVVYIMVVVIFKTENKGSNLTAIMLLLLVGFSGICFGLLISFFSKSYIASATAGVAAMFGLITFSGLIWPIEGSQYVLRILGNLLPLASETVSLRHIMMKGLPFMHPTVLPGFINIICWILSLLVLCIIALKFNK